VSGNHLLARRRVGQLLATPYVKILTMQQVKMTLTVARILREFLTDPSQPRYGYDLMQATGFPSGKLYPALAKLVNAGLLLREKEQIDPAREGRPARYLYWLCEGRAEAARYQLAALSEQIAPPTAGPAPLQVGDRA
jgi:PadR family transcriptional regulator PadR